MDGERGQTQGGGQRRRGRAVGRHVGGACRQRRMSSPSAHAIWCGEARPVGVEVPLHEPEAVRPGVGSPELHRVGRQVLPPPGGPEVVGARPVSRYVRAQGPRPACRRAVARQPSRGLLSACHEFNQVERPSRRRQSVTALQFSPGAEANKTCFSRPASVNWLALERTGRRQTGIGNGCRIAAKHGCRHRPRPTTPTSSSRCVPDPAVVEYRPYRPRSGGNPRDYPPHIHPPDRPAGAGLAGAAGLAAGYGFWEAAHIRVTATPSRSRTCPRRSPARRSRSWPTCTTARSSASTSSARPCG